MKKIMALLASILVFAVPVIAQTTVDSNWVGSGNFETHFVSGDDAHSDLWTGGSSISGEFHAKDYDNNPYGYGVDTYYANVDASVGGGGFITFDTYRDDSKSSMYGNAGQISHSYVQSTDGTAEMAWYTGSNYADMSNCQYAKPTTTNGKNFEASGSSYNIYHSLTDADGDGAMVGSIGSGSAMIKLQGEKAGGQNSYYNMGRLPICGDGCAWDNNYATYSGSGSGQFDLHAWADNGIDVGASCPTCGMSIPGDGSDNSAYYDLTVGFAGTWSYSDFGISGN